MQILGKTPYDFIPIYLEECRTDISLSETTIYTISNILQTFVLLANHAADRKISIKQLASKAGYSRTTIYTYFEDINDIQKCIEEMIHLHTRKNAKMYYQSLLDRLSEEEDLEIITTVANFKPFINAILHIDPSFSARYQENLLNSFYYVAQGGGIPKEIRPLLSYAVSSSLTTIILDNQNPLTESSTIGNGLTAAKIIIKSVFDYGQKLKENGRK